MTRAATIEDRLVHVRSRLGDLYTHLLLPSDARDCVVICSSILGEFEANYHRERLLAKALADSSIAVARFHYAGEGNSTGDRASMTLASMIEDARAVVSHMNALGYEVRAYVGTRVGCLIAATLTNSDNNAPLVLWEPVEQGSHLVRDAERKRRMSGLSRATSSVPSPPRRVGDTGLVELFGFDVPASLLEDLDEAKLMDVLANYDMRIFMGRFGRLGDTDPFAERLRASGFAVDVVGFGFTEAWWYQSEREPESGNLIVSTVEWLMSVLGKRP
jgi:hypothetical protein